jgi:ABC-type nitrate/sulfonate/bicarbonate transport system permease component
MGAAAAVCALPARAQGNMQIVFGCTAVTDFASAFVAAKEGYFKKRSLDVEPRFIPLNSTIPTVLQSDSLLNPGMELFTIAFGAMGPVPLATVHGISTVEARPSEVARCLQMRRLALIWKVGLPNAMPAILAGMRLALTISLIVAVVGEMIASQIGLGQAILLAARSFRASDLFAGIVLLGVIGFASNALTLAESKLQQP